MDLMIQTRFTFRMLGIMALMKRNLHLSNDKMSDKNNVTYTEEHFYNALKTKEV